MLDVDRIDGIVNFHHCKIFMNFDEWLDLDVCTICRIVDSNQFYCFLVNFYSFDRWLYLDVDRIDGIVNVRHFARFSLVTMIFMYFDECLYSDVNTICGVIDFN